MEAEEWEVVDLEVVDLEAAEDWEAEDWEAEDWEEVVLDWEEVDCSLRMHSNTCISHNSHTASLLSIMLATLS